MWQLILCILRTCFISLESKNTDFAVVGYVPEWRFDGIPFDTISHHLTHLILFSTETDNNANIVETDRLPSKDKMVEIRTITKQSNTKLLISFGGYGRSNGFPAVSISNTLQAQFVRNSLKFMAEYQMDGIDLNWEYPSTEQEWIGLFQIIQLFKAKSPDIILTMAFYPGQEKVLCSPLAEQYNLQENIELFLMMSYDNMRNSAHKKSKHSTYNFAVHTVTNALNGGIRANKLALGLPFYARHTVSGDWKTYEEIVKHLRGEGMSDNDIKQLDIYNDYYFNGYNMIIKKTKFALERKIGGLMIWENGQDVHADPLSLLGGIARIVKRGSSQHKEL